MNDLQKRTECIVIYEIEFEKYGLRRIRIRKEIVIKFLIHMVYFQGVIIEESLENLDILKMVKYLNEC